jgi:hypothetical protein
MTGPEHYHEAERLLDLAEEMARGGHDHAEAMAVSNAQVHATLAQSAATALVMGDNGSTPLRVYDEWAAVAGPGATS